MTPIATPSRRKVVSITHTVFHYRKEFHELVHARLKAQGVDYVVVYGQPDRRESKKGDTVDLSFGKKITNRYFYKDGNPIIWQPAVREALSADLIIIIQESRLLINHLLQVLRPVMGLKIALFGHGKNFQSRKPNSLGERVKRFWSMRCDWWFGYTSQTARIIEGLGFPKDRITIFNNAIDTASLRREAEQVTAADLDRIRAKFGLSDGNVGIYVGGIYSDKRLDFLVEAGVKIRALIPDFKLILVGGGPDLEQLRLLAAPHPWVHVTGPCFGREKVELLMLAKVFLMPGLVGLAVLDALVLGLPMITTDYPHHSPEIAYLEPGRTGEIVSDWESSSAYADAVIALLGDPARLAMMAAAAKDSAKNYTVEAMAERFANGVLAALDEGRK
jgi:glycosyltransferase involved in cell wall biosynthesis